MRLHPFTVVSRLANRVLGAGWLVFVGGIVLVRRGVLPAVAVLAALLLVLAVGVAYEVTRYRRFTYELTADSLDIASGVFARREREIPLRRIQNVDVTRSLVARMLGVAVLAVETAGGGQTEATLRYVSHTEARRLQDAIRERRVALGERSSPGSAPEADDGTGTTTTGTAAGTAAGEGSAAATESGSATESAAATGTAAPRRDATSDAIRRERGETLFVLSDRDLLLYGVLGFDPRLLSGVVAIVPFLAPALGGIDRLRELGAGGLFALVLVAALLIWALSAVTRMVRFYGFRLRRVGDELRYERGLLERRDGTVPLDKLQTLTVTENVLMRGFGFAGLGVETAGYAPGSSPGGGSEAAVPIAPRADVLALARDLEDVHAFELTRPPERARRRYVRRYAIAGAVAVAIAVLVARALGGTGWTALALVLALPLAVPAGRRAHATRGYDLGPAHAVTQAGYWRRRTRIVPDYRVQTVITRRTVFQRRWNLATVVLDTAGSRSLTGADAAAIDLDGADADRLAEAGERRLLTAVRARAAGRS